ncbi:MAG TPA: hypothetical protein VED17_03725, partial [Nitrososphaerales archaeon]|nr:hypothetical protein [Nitrososphaerales archaeon]
MSRPDNAQIQLQGIPFPYGVRELGASVEVVKFDGAKDSEVHSWIQKNLFRNGEEKWGILARSKSKEESQFLTIGFKRTTRSRLRLHSGRLERTDEEITEPEMCEFHLKPKEAVLELYSFSGKQRSSLFASMEEEFGKESVQELSLSKDAMKSLMTEAIEVSSVSLSGLGNPFFSDATLTGTDPSNSKTYRELLPSGEIRSFRGKFQSRSEETSSSPLILTISAKCKLRFFSGQSAVL